MKVRRRIGGMKSGMPSVPARLSCVVVRPPPGAWRLTMKVRRRIGGMKSGMPSAPARLSLVVVQPTCRAHGGLL